MMHHETLKETTREAEQKKEKRGREERGIYGRGGYPSAQDEPNGQQQTDRLKTQIKSHFYDVNGWVPWKTLGWILFGRGFGPSQYIFLFYEETQRLRQRLTEWCEPSHLIWIGREYKEKEKRKRV